MGAIEDTATRLEAAAPAAHALRSREVRADELASDSPGARPCLDVVTPPAGGAGNLAAALAAHGDAVRTRLAERGALLFRGFALDDTRAAEGALLAMGTRFDDRYLGGASPRSRLTEHFFSSTEAPGPYVISYHTEMCYLRQRPARVFFYCEAEPSRYGETPLFDCAAMYDRLDTALRERLERHGLLYRRHFGARPARINVYRTWMEAFGTDSRIEVERACERQGMSWRWQADGSLQTEARMPGVVVHPHSGRPCLGLTLYNADAAPCDLRHFAHRFNPLLRATLAAFVRLQYARPGVFMRTLWGDGSDIDRRQTEAILATAWRSATLFRWRRGDLLMVDNVRCGHGRLNVVPPRRIAAALGDPYEVDGGGSPVPPPEAAGADPASPSTPRP